MFIRDLEYCQIEVSDNQFALVNGGGKKSGPVKPAPKPKTPSVALSQISLVGIAEGGTVATTTGDVATVAVATKGSAFALLKGQITSAAVS